MKYMKKFVIVLFVTSCIIANAQEDIKLPKPEKSGGMSLMEALNNRKTIREFTQNELSMQQLSNLLWAACGVNREDGRLTAPTARNMQQIEVYVFIKTGVYLYLPKENLLKQVLKEDHRRDMATQERFQECPLLLLFVANYDKMQGLSEEARAIYEGTDTGNISQNVYLYCASEGLSSCALGSIQREKLKELLKFNGKAILGQSVGVL